MLPNTEHAPTALSQRAHDQAVASFVSRKLCGPECSVAHRAGSVFRTPMPKAPIHKNCDSAFGEHKIRTPEDIHMAPPARDSVAAKKCDQRQFSSLVPTPTDT